MIGRESRRTVRAETSGAARSWSGPSRDESTRVISQAFFTKRLLIAWCSLLAIPRPPEQRIPASKADKEDGGSERGKFLRKFAVDCRGREGGKEEARVSGKRSAIYGRPSTSRVIALRTDLDRRGFVKIARKASSIFTAPIEIIVVVCE